jgi:hypothetical protein
MLQDNLSHLSSFYFVCCKVLPVISLTHGRFMVLHWKRLNLHIDLNYLEIMNCV